MFLIVFRREPLWKVSMNVRVQPTVRCAFVPQENALKFILKENVESSGFNSPEASQELVIYVLKVCPCPFFVMQTQELVLSAWEVVF